MEQLVSNFITKGFKVKKIKVKHLASYTHKKAIKLDREVAVMGKPEEVAILILKLAEKVSLIFNVDKEEVKIILIKHFNYETSPNAII